MPTSPPPPRGLRELDTDECYELLATQTLGRLGVVIEHYPEVLPVNYALDNHVVVFRSHAGPKLDAAHHANVTFQVDAVDVPRRLGWSVLVRGLAEVVDQDREPERAARSRAAGAEPWVSGAKPHVVRVIPAGVSGRLLVADDLDEWTDPRGYL